MKTIKMIAQFYIGNMIPTLLVAVILFFSMYNMIYCVGVYRYLNFSEQTFQHSGLENAVYFMTHLSDGQSQADYMLQEEKLVQLKKTLESEPLVNQVLSIQFNSMMYQGKTANYLLYGNDFEKAFPINLQDGSFNPNKFHEDVNTLNAVVGGYLFNRVSVGDNLSMIGLDKEGKPVPITVHVTGKMKDPAFVPDFGSSGMVYADDFYVERDNAVLVSQMEFQEKFSDRLKPIVFENFFIDFSFPPESTEVQKLLDQYRMYGSYRTYPQILEDSREKNGYQEKKLLPLPLFFTLITTVSLFSISILLVEKKWKEHSVYYLCGCSRKKSYFYMVASISIPVLIAGGINLLIIGNYPYLSQHGYIDFGKVIVDQACGYPVVIYMLISCLISTVFPYFIYRKKSLIELYRRRN